MELTAVTTVEIGSNGNGNGRKPHDFKQGDTHRYRVRFAKLGVAALTGHLDLVRTLPRVLRRAGINAYYSEGYHPKPVMEFSPPLPLGVRSLGEWVDISLAEEMTPETMLEKLRVGAPDGLEFLEAIALPPGSRKLGACHPRNAAARPRADRRAARRPPRPGRATPRRLRARNVPLGPQADPPLGAHAARGSPPTRRGCAPPGTERSSSSRAARSQGTCQAGTRTHPEARPAPARGRR